MAHPFCLSVAHGGCATEPSPLNYISMAHPTGAPQKDQDSVAHPRSCATEMFQWRIPETCATEIGAPQNKNTMRHRIFLHVFAICCCPLYKYRYIYRIIETIIYTYIIQIMCTKQTYYYVITLLRARDTYI